MSEAEVIDAVARAAVVPVARFETPEQAVLTVRALARGGIRCVEVTFRTPAAEAAIAMAREVPGMTVGAGTVLTTDQARAAWRAGAAFALAPGSNPAVIEACAEMGLPFFPGVATPTEIEAARARGCRILKVFPAELLGGTAFLRAVTEIYPDVRFIPTGGVTPANLAAYLALECVVAVGGSWLVSPSLLRAERYDEVERLARAAASRRAPVGVA